MKTRASGENLRDVFLFIWKQLVRFFCLICSEMFFFFLHTLYVSSFHYVHSCVFKHSIAQHSCTVKDTKTCPEFGENGRFVTSPHLANVGVNLQFMKSFIRKNRRRKSWICSINTERRRAGGTCVTVASWTVTPLRIGRTWLLDMTLPASHTAAFFPLLWLQGLFDLNKYHH